MLALRLALAFAIICVSPAAASFRTFDPMGNGDGYPAESNGRVTDVPWISAYRLNGEGITLDGKLDDAAWSNASAGLGFRIWDPDRGAMPNEETVFKVAYDEGSMYFGVACYEKDPSKIVSNLARRDQVDAADVVSIYLDPYHDKTTGYNFRVNPSGVQNDSYMFNDGDRDVNWNAVWDAETFRDDKGWYAEFKIPFSAIRYRPTESMTWGLQVYRYMHGRGEDTAWVTWPRETRGFISRFGEIRDIREIPAPRQLEFLPYFLQSATDPSVDPGVSGTADEVNSLQNFGADVKYGVTADLTLNSTINPDFGQVEADPATLNLSPFETFYEEKRLFFIEGSKFFGHPDFNLFYSRRIGTGDENSRIRLAAKLTGKTKNNFSVGALAATTDIANHSQPNNIFNTGDQVSNYFVGRIGKELNEANYKFNLMGTAALQSADRAEFGDRASREAYTGGMDFDLNFKDRMYNIQGSMVGSFIDSEPLPDDPQAAATKKGTGGSLDVRKVGGNLQAGTNFRWEGDKLDINDLGFLSAPDEISSSLWARYIYNPEGESKTFNQGEINFNLWKNWLYAGRQGYDAQTEALVWSYDPWHRQYQGTNVNGWMQYRNYWENWFGIEVMPEGTQRYETRGGPLMDEPTTYGGWLGGTTDVRKNFKFEAETSYFADVQDNWTWRIYGGLRWNQNTAVNHRLSLNYNNRYDDTQYLETVNLSQRPGGMGIGGLSYVFGDIHQETYDVTLRSNLLFSRDLSLELYLQPFLTVGDYRAAYELGTADSYDLVPYVEAGYNVANNDFSYAAMNVNMVFRWEYRPGSTIFLVWTHAREEYDERSFYNDPGEFHNDLGGNSMFQNEPQNVFMAKISYWFTM